ncbi:MAG: FliI/YscN family ATPase [Planctomycetota bacterium]
MTTLPDVLEGALQGALGPDGRAPGAVTQRGRVVAVTGLGVRLEGLRLPIGTLCQLGGQPEGDGGCLAEIVGFDGGEAIAVPLGSDRGLHPGMAVSSRALPIEVPVGDRLLGRILDPLGRPLDGGPVPLGPRRGLFANAPDPMSRRPIQEPFQTGVSAIDGFTTLGRGQRMGLFAGSGVGKSTLMGSIVRGSQADRRVVCLLGERGREVSEFVHEILGPEGLATSVVIVATAETPAPLRVAGAFASVTIAEAFREEGHDVLFVLDSVTRFAMAVREIGLAAGEPPTLRGYPPSLFGRIPSLVERLGNDSNGSITALLTVLVEGDDHDEPVADALRGHLDGHLVLSREIAERGRFPAVDVLRSVSRAMPRVVTEEHLEAVNEARKLLSVYEDGRDLVRVGAWKKGADPELDRAVERAPMIEEVLRQHALEGRAFADTLQALRVAALG